MTLKVRRCTPTPTDHCCWVNGSVCRYFDAATPNTDRRCTLRTELGSWDAVHADPRYLADVAPAWADTPTITNCGEWTPTISAPCGSCEWDGT